MHIIHRNRVAHFRLSRIKLAPQRWMRSQKSLLLRERYLQADWTEPAVDEESKSLLLREKGDRAAVDEESKCLLLREKGDRAAVDEEEK